MTAREPGGAAARPATDQPRLQAGVRRIGSAVAWLLIAVALALGGAGVVAGIDHPAGIARPELTWAADRAVRPQLDAATAELRQLTDEVDQLGALGRGSLGAIVANEDAQLRGFLDEGESLLGIIDARSTELARSVNGMPGFGPGEELRIGQQERDRHAALASALGATIGLRSAWTGLQSAGGAATRIGALLEEHDKAAFAATTSARSLDYADAVTKVEAAQAVLGEIGTLRDGLRNVADVSTLDDHLRRYGAYDDALHRLYVAFRDAKGRVTAEARAAIEAEREARNRLPSTDQPVRIILAEIGRGGGTRAVLAIEEARGQLSAALEDLATITLGAAPDATLAP